MAFRKAAFTEDERAEGWRTQSILPHMQPAIPAVHAASSDGRVTRRSKYSKIGVMNHSYFWPG